MRPHCSRTTAFAATAAFISAFLALHAGGAAAQSPWPAKPVKVWVPVAPGNTPDTVTRMVTERLAPRLGTAIVVENRAGSSASRQVTEQVARSAADGYTVLSTMSAHIQLPSLFKNLSFDPIRDFAPITQMVGLEVVFAVRGDLPVKNIREFIALAKASPAQLSYGSAGLGTSYHLSGSALSKATGANLLHVPYKGATAALNDMVGGRIDASFGAFPVLSPYFQTGRAKPLLMISPRRSALLPDIPTAGEIGMADTAAWFGLLAPRGTPPGIVSRIQSDVKDILREPEVNQRLIEGGMVGVGSTPEEFATMLKASLSNWKKIIEDAGLTAAE